MGGFFFYCYGPYEVARCKILALHLRASMQVASKVDICLFGLSVCWSCLGATKYTFSDPTPKRLRTTCFKRMLSGLSAVFELSYGNGISTAVHEEPNSEVQ